MAFSFATLNQMKGEAFFGRTLDTVMVREDLISQNAPRQTTAMKQIIAFVTTGKDMSGFYNDVAQLTSSSDYTIKRLVYLYLMHTSRTQPEKAVLQAGAFVKDTVNDSPLIRGAALRTMASLLVPSMVDFVVPPTKRCLSDSDPYVRRIAAFAVLKVFSLSPSVCQETGLLTDVQELLGDEVPMVVAAAVTTLLEILQRSGLVSVERALLAHLSSMLNAMEETYDVAQHYLLEGISLQFATACSSRQSKGIQQLVLQQQQHLTLEEGEKTVVRVLKALTSVNAAVATSAAKVIIAFLLYFTGAHSSLPQATQDQLVEKYVPRIVDPFMALLSTSRDEVRFLTLTSIRVLLLMDTKKFFVPYLTTFFVKFDDALCVKMEKIDILVDIATPATGKQVLSELVLYAAESDVELAEKSVHAIGRLAVAVEEVAPDCVTQLEILLRTKVNYVVQEVAVVVQVILRQYPKRFSEIVPTLRDSLEIATSTEAKAALAWVFGDCADDVDIALESLELFLKDFVSEDRVVQLAVLGAIVKLYLRTREAETRAGSRPSAAAAAEKATQLLDSILKISLNSGFPDLCDRAIFYWRLLSKDLAGAHKLILSEKLAMVPAEDLSEASVHELAVQLGSVTAVYQRPLMLLLHDRLHGACNDDALDDVDEADSDDGETNGAPEGVVEGADGTYDAAAINEEHEGRALANVEYENDEHGGAEQSSSGVSTGAGAGVAGSTAGHSTGGGQRAATESHFSTVLDRYSGGGVEVQMAWGQSGTHPLLRCRFQLHLGEDFVSHVRISTVQINVNMFGLGIAQSFPAVTLEEHHLTATADLEVHCNNRKKPLRDLQIAIQMDPVGVKYIVAPPIPHVFLLLPATGCDVREYIAAYNTIAAPAWSMPAQLTPAITDASKLTANALRVHNLNLVYTEDLDGSGGAMRDQNTAVPNGTHGQVSTEGTRVGMLLFAETIAGQKLFIDVLVDRNEVAMMSVRCSDDAVASLFGEYALRAILVKK